MISQQINELVRTATRTGIATQEKAPSKMQFAIAIYQRQGPVYV